MQWLEQTTGGCGIACLAMLLEVPYNRVREMAPGLCEDCGVEEEVIDHFLAAHGYAVQRFHPYQEYDGQPAAAWPPKPWAEKHLALVLQTKKDFVAHHVVIDGKGLVLDPADSAHRKVRLSRYYRVLSVAAVVPVR